MTMNIVKIRHEPKYNAIESEFDLDKIENIYVGKKDCCRCGCGGEYYKPSDDGFQRALKRFISTNQTAESIDGYILEKTTGDDRCITIYFPEPKKPDGKN